MAGSLTQFGEKLLLNYSIGTAETLTANIPAQNGGLYCGLGITSTVPETGAEVEFSEPTWPAVSALVDATGYKRQRLLPGSWLTDTSAEATKLTYNAEIVFPLFTGTTEITVLYLVLYSKETGGKAIWYTTTGTVAAPGRRLTYGDQIKVEKGKLILTLT